MKIKMPAQAAKVIQTLVQHGFEAYIVGGCVRDSILGRTPGDWDITTSASPQEVKEIFDHTVDTGIEHGTVTVLMNHEPYEVTTYRVDGKYEDHRRPNEVHFTKSLREDLLRRDFTINAMAYNDSEGIIDMYDGMTDLKNQTIRCVGEAKKRFDEDALRILRALRFQAQLGFQIDLPNKQLQSRMACKSGMNFQGRPIHFDLVDDWGYPIPQEDLYVPHFRANCETCGSKLICNGCSDCGKCL